MTAVTVYKPTLMLYKNALANPINLLIQLIISLSGINTKKCSLPLLNLIFIEIVLSTMYEMWIQFQQ